MRSSRMGQDYETKGDGGKSGIAGRVFIIIIVCVVIYFVSAGAVGKWIAQNIVTPVLSLFEDNDAATGSEGPEAQAPGTAQNTGEKVNEKIVLPDLSVFALQIGVYAEQANADEAAGLAQERGGAGYILNDGNMRVLLSAYETQDEAKSVSDNLLSTENYETYEYDLAAKGVTFDITAHQENLDAIRTFFEITKNIHDTYFDLTLKFDKKEITADDVLASLAGLREDAQPNIEAIQAMNKEGDTVLGNMKNFADGLEECLNVDLAGKTDVEISSQLKYNYIWLSDLYRNFIDGFK